jgi:hypothetical protein
MCLIPIMCVGACVCMHVYSCMYLFMHVCTCVWLCHVNVICGHVTVCPSVLGHWQYGVLRTSGLEGDRHTTLCSTHGISRLFVPFRAMPRLYCYPATSQSGRASHASSLFLVTFACSCCIVSDVSRAYFVSVLLVLACMQA